MPIYQSFNSRTGRWVKYHFKKGGIEIIDNKQREPQVPFKNVPIKMRKR